MGRNHQPVEAIVLTASCAVRIMVIVIVTAAAAVGMINIIFAGPRLYSLSNLMYSKCVLRERQDSAICVSHCVYSWSLLYTLRIKVLKVRIPGFQNQ